MEILEKAQALLGSSGIPSKTEEGVLRIPVQTGILGSQMRIFVSNGLLKCIIYIPIFTPLYRRLQVAEAIARANFRLNSGRFELDMEDGEVRFFNSLPVFDSSPTDEQVSYLLFWSWQTATRYCIALFECAMTDINPEVAIARAEASLPEGRSEAMFS